MWKTSHYLRCLLNEGTKRHNNSTHLSSKMCLALNVSADLSIFGD